jgi:hypothetical protein
MDDIEACWHDVEHLERLSAAILQSNDPEDFPLAVAGIECSIAHQRADLIEVFDSVAKKHPQSVSHDPTEFASPQSRYAMCQLAMLDAVEADAVGDIVQKCKTIARSVQDATDGVALVNNMTQHLWRLIGRHAAISISGESAEGLLMLQLATSKQSFRLDQSEVDQAQFGWWMDMTGYTIHALSSVGKTSGAQKLADVVTKVVKALDTVALSKAVAVLSPLHVKIDGLLKLPNSNAVAKAKAQLASVLQATSVTLRVKKTIHEAVDTLFQVRGSLAASLLALTAL